MWAALAAPPNRTSRSVNRRMSTGASREMRAGLPIRYSSMIRSPTTMTVRALNRLTMLAWIARRPSRVARRARTHSTASSRSAATWSGSAGKCVAAVFPLTQPVSGQHQHAARARTAGRRERRRACHPRPWRRPDRARARRPHAGADRAGACGSRSARERAARPRSGGGDTRRCRPDAPPRLQLAHELVVDGVEDVFREVAARHAGLIGRHDGGQPGGVELSDRLRRARQQPKALGMIDVAHFFGEGSVAIDEGSRPSSHVGSLRRSLRFLKKIWTSGRSSP